MKVCYRCKVDLHVAAGSLAIPIPEPGSTMGQLLSANVLLRRERDQARNDREDTAKLCRERGTEIANLKAKLAFIEKELTKIEGLIQEHFEHE